MFFILLFVIIMPLNKNTINTKVQFLKWDTDNERRSTKPRLLVLCVFSLYPHFYILISCSLCCLPIEIYINPALFMTYLCKHFILYMFYLCSVFTSKHIWIKIHSNLELNYFTRLIEMEKISLLTTYWFKWF